MNIARRIMLELWAVLVLAGVIAFMGPFGTYLMGDYLSRFWHWWGLLTGAYVTMRPIMLACSQIARFLALPPSALVFWGMMLASFPLALLWQVTSTEHTRLFGGYGGLLSFTFLCAGAVIAVAWWARKADAFLVGHTERATVKQHPAGAELPGEDGLRPRLHSRLSPGFNGQVIALQSEDHYVRVHGAGNSELVLMRLRDAIMEMDDLPGIQTHRSWWVARDGVATVSLSEKKPAIMTMTGIEVPVARNSIDRVKEFLATGS